MSATGTGGSRTRIPLRLGDHLATVDAPADLDGVLRSTLTDVVRGTPEPVGALVRVTREGGNEHLDLDGLRWDPGPDQTIVDQLIYLLLRATLDAEPDRLHLHAGLVARGGAGVVLAGVAGAGKSTLVAGLVGRGFDFLTDERIALDTVGAPRGLPLPLSVVAGSFDLLRHLDPRRTGRGAWSHRLWHVPASVVRPGCVVDEALPVAVAFVEYRRDGGPTTTGDLHAAEAARLLLADSPDAVRFGHGSVELTARLTASARCTRLRFSDVEEAITALETLVGLGPPAPVSLERLRPDPTRARARARRPIAAGSVLGPTPGVTGVAVDGRCLLAVPGGQVCELDPVASSWFRLLDGSTPLAAIVHEVAEGTGMPPPQVADVAERVLTELAEMDVIR